MEGLKFSKRITVRLISLFLGDDNTNLGKNFPLGHELKYRDSFS